MVSTNLFFSRLTVFAAGYLLFLYLYTKLLNGFPGFWKALFEMGCQHEIWVVVWWAPSILVTIYLSLAIYHKLGSKWLLSPVAVIATAVVVTGLKCIQIWFRYDQIILPKLGALMCDQCQRYYWIEQLIMIYMGTALAAILVAAVKDSGVIKQIRKCVSMQIAFP